MKILIIYNSTTGNNEIIATNIRDLLIENNKESEVLCGDEVSIEEINSADLLFIGSSTWGDGELSDTGYDFLDTIQDQDLSNKQVFIFANGDNAYPDFCGSAKILDEELTKCKAIVCPEHLKIDGVIEESIGEIHEWTEEIINNLNI